MRKISNALSKNRLESIRGEVKETLVMTISAQPQRPMRRRDRELPREEALRAARAAGHAVLSFIHPDTGAPQGVPISPVVTPEGIVYWHSTNEASLKGEGLKQDPRASLTFIAYAEDLPEEYTVDYASTVMTGRAHIVTDPQERRQAMLEICRRYAGADRDAISTEYFDHAGSQIDVWRFDPEMVSGKSRSWTEKVSHILAKQGF